MPTPSRCATADKRLIVHAEVNAEEPTDVHGLRVPLEGAARGRDSRIRWPTILTWLLLTVRESWNWS